MALPNDSLDKVKVYPNEYIDNISVNRSLARLFSNDEYLFENTIKIVDAPSGVDASGNTGDIALSGDMLYAYSPVSSGELWGRVQLSYSW